MARRVSPKGGSGRHWERGPRGRSAVREWFRDNGLLDTLFVVLAGLTIGALLFLLLWVMPKHLSYADRCTELGGVYKSGTCFKVNGAYQLD